MPQPRPIHRRYQRDFWPPMLAYVLIMFLLWPLLPRVHSELLKVALAVLPVLPVLFVVRAMVRLVLGGDELEQRIHLIGLAIAATAVSSLSLVGGFLAAAGVVRLDGSILIGVWPLLMVLYAAGRSWAGRHYGAGGDVMCESSASRHWRLLLVALVLLVIAGIGRHWLGDEQLGMLCGIAVGLMLLAVMQALRRRRSGGGDEIP